MRLPLPILFLVALCFGCDSQTANIAESNQQLPNSALPRPTPSMSQTETKIFATNAAEGLVLKLTPKFAVLSAMLQNDRSNTEILMAPSIEYRGPSDFHLPEQDVFNIDPDDPVAHFQWPIDQQKKTVSPADIWKPITDQISLSETKVGVLDVHVHEDADILEMKTSIEGRFQSSGGQIIALKSKQTLLWKLFGDDWKIFDWEQNSVGASVVPRALLVDATAAAMPEKAVQTSFTSVKHRQQLQEMLTQGPDTMKGTEYETLPDWEASMLFSSVSVFDYDNDSFDDFLILDRHAEPLLMRNDQQGGFKDIAEEAGLRGIGLTGCSSILFDYDNDGDADLFVCKALTPSQFFRNEKGKFVADKPTNAFLTQVRFVFSGSVVDINRDGLLDLYLCTYGASNKTLKNVTDPITETRIKMLFDLAKQGHPYTDRIGLPNIMLINKGGSFQPIELSQGKTHWRHSYQSTWVDYDRDGDADLYVCNDFAPDFLLRNDTERGSSTPRLVDVSQYVLPGAMGFGMGASFGDYNSDGNIDLYVSNMYSKAGNRVFNQLGGSFDPRIRIAANGNFLHKNIGGKFEQVAGLSADQKQVAKVGWSFGGQMMDLNNDTHLDMYVPSGFYSAPQTADTKVDL